jgi:hypothetical protein
MPKINVDIDLGWYHMQLLKEIEEKHYDSHKIIKLIKMIAERNIEVICKLFEYFKENNVEDGDDIKTFIEKYW